jgi:hypothetical protein
MKRDPRGSQDALRNRSVWTNAVEAEFATQNLKWPKKAMRDRYLQLDCVWIAG